VRDGRFKFPRHCEAPQAPWQSTAAVEEVTGAWLLQMAAWPVDAPHWIAAACGLAMTEGAGQPHQMNPVIARPQAVAIQGGGAGARSRG